MKNDDSERVGRLQAAPRKKAMFKIKVCQQCGEEYQPTNATQKYCIECGIVARAEGHRVLASEWYRENSERGRAYSAKYREINPETSRATRDKWRLAHPEYNQERRKANPGYEKAWRAANPESVRLTEIKARAKRRALGFYPLNSWFAGCDGHHINSVDVIYLPSELHRSVWHNQWTGQGMEEMNTLAEEWMSQNGKRETLPLSPLTIPYIPTKGKRDR